MPTVPGVLTLMCTLAAGCYNDPGAGDDGSSATDATDDGAPDPTGVGSTNTPDPDDDDDGSPSSDDTDDADTAEPDSSGGEPSDTTAPTIVASFPEDQAVGIAADVVLSVTFSEPMNKASVQAAYQSASLPASAVTMSWNAAGDQLMVTPNAALAYGFSSSPDNPSYESYAFSISTAATDLAGNELEDGVQVSFTTFAHISQTVPILGALSGGVRQDHTIFFDAIIVGDSGSPAPNLQWKGFASFPLYDLPDDMAYLLEARLIASQIAVSGDPYIELGAVEVHDVAFFVIGQEAFQAPSQGALGVFSDSTALGQYTFDVTDAVWDDFVAGSDTTQFCLQFPVATNANSNFDNVLFHSTGNPPSALEVEYLLP